MEPAVIASKGFRITLILLIISCTYCEKAPADWSTYRADQARTGFGQFDLGGFCWQPAWYSDSNVRPQPAWPAPARASLWQNLESISPRQREDLADVPLIASDTLGKTHLIIGSSGGDFLQSLSIDDGTINWHIPLLAPLRFAPIIDHDIVYFGCDDGFVTALNLSDGSLVWRTCVGPRLPWIVGNGRVISPHPVRTSLLLDDDKVIAHAGLFPSQGVYCVALHRETGDLIWRRRLDTSPQGYLLSDGAGRGIVPTGRAKPYLIELADGQVSDTLPSPGGSFCMLTAQRVYTGPGNSNQVDVAAHGAEKRLVNFPSQAIVAGNAMIWTADGQYLACYREADLKEGNNTSVWQVPCQLAANLIAAGGDSSHVTLFTVGGPEIHVFHALEGKLLQKLEVPDTEENLIHVACSAEGSTASLVATSTSGSIYVWKGVRKSVQPEETQTSSIEWAGLSADNRPNDLIEKPTRIAEKAAAPNTSNNSTIENPSPLKVLQARLPCPVGLGLWINVDDLGGIQQFLAETDYQLIVIAKDQRQEIEWREIFTQSGQYGRRVCIWPHDFLENHSFEDQLFNVVVVSGEYHTKVDPRRLCANDGLLVILEESEQSNSYASDNIIQIQNRSEGVWRHQYASPTNDADAKDPAFREAVGFRLKWFGGIGPRRIPDRHLRGAAPLVAGSTMIIHGDGCIIGVDPANGKERWQLKLPQGAMRYVIPYDSGYSCLSADGENLYVAAKAQIWQINPKTGQIVNRFYSPEDLPHHSWGYLSEVQGSLFATLMPSVSPRYSQDRVVLRQSFINDDYNSDRPLVCSNRLLRLGPDGKIVWQRQSSGVIPNSTISIDDEGGSLIFVEGTSEQVLDAKQARFTPAEILQAGNLICLDGETGKSRWELELEWPAARNMLYSLIADGRVVLTTSRSENERAIYATKVFSLTDGRLLWEKEHTHVREGLFHGEQVHHPVGLRRADGSTVLIVEPYMYDLASGNTVVPSGMPKDWVISRPGHSCGTMTGSADCLFFRANNPTVFNFSAKNSQNQFVKLSPSRPSCWINMVPAAGRLFIPEGSASCVCQYSLQTSMAFEPVGEQQYDQHWLVDVLPKQLH